MKQVRSKSGYTLMEIIAVVIIIGVLAGVALPKFGTAMERMKSKEGTQILSSLLTAQLNADVDVSSGRVATYNMAYLDVVIPTPDSFDAPTLRHDGVTTDTVNINATAYPVYAEIDRTGGAYTLYIQADGTILCDTQTICTKMGYAPW